MISFLEIYYNYSYMDNYDKLLPIDQINIDIYGNVVNFDSDFNHAIERDINRVIKMSARNTMDMNPQINFLVYYQYEMVNNIKVRFAFIRNGKNIWHRVYFNNAISNQVKFL
jgi:hypothetical protein